MKRLGIRGVWALCAAALLCAGCSQEQSDYRQFGKDDDVTNTTPADHDDHHEVGPHGGHVVELGTYHGELVMDASRNVTVYILGDDAKTAAPVLNAIVTLHVHPGAGDQEMTLTASPQAGETGGNSSRFAVKAELIPAAVKDIEDLHGELELTIDGQTTHGDIVHDHDHDH